MAEDQTPQNTNAAPQTQGPSIQIMSQYIKDLSVENPNSPASLITGWGQPETNVQINIRTQQIKDDVYESALMFRIEARCPQQDNKVAFIVELSYAAAVELKNVPEENIQAVLMIEVPKLLFPFAREIIGNSTVKAGFPPLFLQPISFEAIYAQDQQRRQAGEEQSAGAEATTAQSGTA